MALSGKLGCTSRFEVELLLQRLGARRLQFRERDAELLVGEFDVQREPLKIAVRAR